VYPSIPASFTRHPEVRVAAARRVTALPSTIVPGGILHQFCPVFPFSTRKVIAIPAEPRGEV